MAKSKKNEESGNIADSDVSKEMQKRFNELQYNYFQALQNTQVEADKVPADAHQVYLQAVQDAQIKAQMASIAAFQTYQQELNMALTEKAPDNPGTEAYQKYVQALNQRQLETEKICIDAYNKYMQEVVDIQKKAQENFENVYRDYVTALKEWWSQANVEAVDAMSLAAIGQSISATAIHSIGAFAGSKS